MNKPLKNIYLYFLEKRAISKADITTFLRQLSTFMHSGLSLPRSLSFLKDNQIKPNMRHLISDLEQMIQTGQSFSTALAKHPKYFDAIACHLIQLGEHTGKFDKTLEALTHYQEKNMALKQKIKNALFYPTIVISLSILITLSLLYFIVPHFAHLFAHALDKLPLMTAYIFCFSKLLHDYLWMFTLIIITLILLFLLYYEFFMHLLQKLFKKLQNFPMIQNFHRQIAIAQFSRHLSLTLTSGIAILEALILAGSAADHPRLNLMLLSMTQKARGGTPLSVLMTNTAFFPALFIQFIKIGEESGKLDQMLLKYADIADAHIETMLNRANQLLEPLIMLCLGALIGGLVIGMYLPLFKLGSVL